MMKRVTLALLIVLLPIQSWAVVDMSLQKEALQFGTTLVSSSDNHHPCHQVVLSTDDQNTEDKKTSCNACSLCMAFSATLIANPTLRFESPKQSYFISVLGFSSEDLVLGNKPPIL